MDRIIVARLSSMLALEPMPLSVSRIGSSVAAGQISSDSLRLFLRLLFDMACTHVQASHGERSVFVVPQSQDVPAFRQCNECQTG